MLFQQPISFCKNYAKIRTESYLARPLHLIKK